MSVRRVLEWPHAALSKPGRAIAPEMFGGDEVYQCAQDLRDTVAAHRGSGLAAAQIGIDLAMFVIVAAHGAVVVCNPEIVAQEGSQLGIEGCLSFRSVGWQMRAPAKIAFKFRDEDGVEHEGGADARDAHVFFQSCRRRCGPSPERCVGRCGRRARSRRRHRHDLAAVTSRDLLAGRRDRADGDERARGERGAGAAPVRASTVFDAINRGEVAKAMAMLSDNGPHRLTRQR